MNPKVAFRTEGNANVGLGHLKECLSLAKRLETSYAVQSLFIINSNTIEIQELSNFAPAVERLPANNGRDYSSLTSQILKENEINLVVTNLRSVDSRYLGSLKKKGFTVICIDELGDREIIADVVINGSIVKDWHRYQFRSQTAETYFGPKYMILDEAFSSFHQKGKPILTRATNVLVSMGGADVSGATLRVIEGLDKLDKEIQKSIIIGPGFPHHSELKGLLPEPAEHNFKISYNVSNMAQSMFEADLAISHGGDTLYELACVGTPNLVLYEVEHEGIQAGVFEQKGATIRLGKGTEVPTKQITAAVSSLLQDEAKRRGLSQHEKRLIDGRGTDRVCSIILEKLRQ